MKAELSHFESGWKGLSLGIKEAEIDSLISCLENLRDSREHFHCRSDFSGEPGVGDIEVYLLNENESGNLEIEP